MMPVTPDPIESPGSPPERSPRTTSLTDGPVHRTLVRMAAPMLGGAFAMHAFNLTDTWFVSMLGTKPLAAMGFTFPVVFFIAFLVRGLGTGATALVSHALGRGDLDRARRLTTHALLLALVVVGVIAVAGLTTIDPLFRGLGAGDAVLPLIGQYMRIWYAGIAFMVLPMIANDIIRATGDTVRPSLLMVLGSMLNMVLDPVMIFGLAGCPALGIRGAALATLVARAVTCAASLLVLHRHGLLIWTLPAPDVLGRSWRRVLGIGIPSACSNLMMPLSRAVITRIVAGYGEPAVAACAAGGRVEMFAFMVPMCLGMSLMPFVGQNCGAGRLDRVRQARQQSMVFAFLFGLGTCVAFCVAAPGVAACFSDDPEVILIMTAYLRIVSVGHGMMEVHRYAGFFLNGMHRPMQAMGVNAARVLGLLIPLSLLGGRWFGLHGVFMGRAAADVGAGLIGFLWSGWILRTVANREPNDGAAGA